MGAPNTDVVLIRGNSESQLKSRKDMRESRKKTELAEVREMELTSIPAGRNPKERITAQGSRQKEDSRKCRMAKTRKKNWCCTVRLHQTNRKTAPRDEEAGS